MKNMTWITMSVHMLSKVAFLKDFKGFEIAK